MAVKPPSVAPNVNAPALLPLGSRAGGAPLRLTKSVVLVGTEKICHLRIVSSSISRYHALILTGPEGVVIRDLASRTKVIINGQPVVEAILNDGDEIAMGTYRFKFMAPAGGFTLPPALPAAAVSVRGMNAVVAMNTKILLIGRQPGCDIQIPSESVSTRHAVIFELSGKRMVRDLNSRKGTILNGKPIHQQEIKFGDALRVGDTIMELIASPSTVSAESMAAGTGVSDEIDLNADPDVADIPGATAMMESIAEIPRMPIIANTPRREQESPIEVEMPPAAEATDPPAAAATKAETSTFSDEKPERGWRRTPWQAPAIEVAATHEPTAEIPAPQETIPEISPTEAPASEENTESELIDLAPAPPEPEQAAEIEAELPPVPEEQPELIPLEPAQAVDEMPTEQAEDEQIEEVVAPAAEESTPAEQEIAVFQELQVALDPALPDFISTPPAPIALPPEEELATEPEAEIPPVQPAPLETDSIAIAAPEETREEIAPSEPVPLDETPVDELPAQESPEEMMPVRTAPTETLPVKEAPEEIPVDLSPTPAIEETPEEIAPAVAEIPMESAPVVEPVAQAPADISPLEIPQTPSEPVPVQEVLPLAPGEPSVEAPIEQRPDAELAPPRRRRGRPRKNPLPDETAEKLPRARTRRTAPKSVLPPPAEPIPAGFENLQLDLRPEAEVPAPVAEQRAPEIEPEPEPINIPQEPAAPLLDADLDLDEVEKSEAPAQPVEPRIEGLEISDADFIPPQAIPEPPPVAAAPRVDLQIPQESPPPTPTPAIINEIPESSPTSRPAPLPRLMLQPEEKREVERPIESLLDLDLELPPLPPVADVRDNAIAPVAEAQTIAPEIPQTGAPPAEDETFAEEPVSEAPIARPRTVPPPLPPMRPAPEAANVDTDDLAMEALVGPADEAPPADLADLHSEDEVLPHPSEQFDDLAFDAVNDPNQPPPLPVEEPPHELSEIAAALPPDELDDLAMEVMSGTGDAEAMTQESPEPLPTEQGTLEPETMPELEPASELEEPAEPAAMESEALAPADEIEMPPVANVQPEPMPRLEEKAVPQERTISEPQLPVPAVAAASVAPPAPPVAPPLLTNAANVTYMPPPIFPQQRVAPPAPIAQQTPQKPPQRWSDSFSLDDGFFANTHPAFTVSIEERGVPGRPPKASSATTHGNAIQPQVQSQARMPRAQIVPVTPPVVPEPMHSLGGMPIFADATRVEAHLGSQQLNLPELPPMPETFGRVNVGFAKQTPLAQIAPPPKPAAPALPPPQPTAVAPPQAAKQPQLLPVAPPLPEGELLMPKEPVPEAKRVPQAPAAEIAPPPPIQPPMVQPQQQAQAAAPKSKSVTTPPRPKRTSAAPPAAEPIPRPPTFATEGIDITEADLAAEIHGGSSGSSIISAFDGLAMPTTHERDVFSDFSITPSAAAKFLEQAASAPPPAVPGDMQQPLDADRDFADDDFWNQTDEAESAQIPAAPQAAAPAPKAPAPIPQKQKSPVAAPPVSTAPAGKITPAPVAPVAHEPEQIEDTFQEPMPLAEEEFAEVQAPHAPRQLAPVAALPAKPPKKRRKFLIFFLLMMVLAMGAAVGGIVFLWPPRTHVVGSLTYLNFYWVDGTDDGNNFAASQKRLMEDAQTSARAQAWLAQHFPNVSPGFLADQSAFVRVADGSLLSANRNVNGGPSTTMKLAYDGMDQAHDGVRMLAMLQAIDESNAPILDKNNQTRQQADMARRAADDSAQKLQAVKDQIAAAQKIIANQPTTDMLAQLSDAAQKLHKTRMDAEDIVDNDRLTLSRIQSAIPTDAAAAGGDKNATTQPVDPQLQQMHQEMDDLNGRLADAKTQQAAAAVGARAQLQDADQQFNDQINSASAKLDDASQLKQFLNSVQDTQAKARDMIQTMLIDGQDLQKQLESTRRDMEDLIQSRQQQVWAADVQLQHLQENLDSSQHRYNAAVGSGITDESQIVPLQREIDGWTARVKSRQAELGVDPSEIKVEDGLNKLLAAMRNKLDKEKQQLDDVLSPLQRQLSDLNPVIAALPAEQQDLAKQIRQKLDTLNKAREHFAQAVGESPSSPSASVTDLQQRIADLQARFDRRQTDLTQLMQGTASADRSHDLADAQKTLDADKTAAEKAKADYEAARVKYDQAVGHSEDAQAAALKVDQLRQDLATLGDENEAVIRDRDIKQGAADLTFDVQTPSDSDVMIQQLPDPRRDYSLFAVAALAVGFAVTAMLMPQGRRDEYQSDANFSNHTDLTRAIFPADEQIDADESDHLFVKPTDMHDDGRKALSA